MVLLLLTSCDKNKSKIEKMTVQFITSVKSQDKATVYDMFPEAKTFEDITLPDSIPEGEIKVTKDKKTGDYIASIDNARETKILFTKVGEDKFKIKDTYCVFLLDSANNEIAIKSGVPLKQITDLTIAKLFEADSEYFNFLFDKFADVISGTLTYESGTWQAQGGWYPTVTATVPIRNIGSVPINGYEYSVEVNFYSPNGTAASLKMVQEGVDLEPGEAYTYTIFPGGAYYRACMAHDFNWTVSFVYKNQSPIDGLLMYAKFTGKEFDEFQAKHPNATKPDAGADSTTVKQVKVTGTNVRLRTSPEINNSNIIKSSNGTNLHPKKGATLDCIGEAGEFYKVKYQDKEAYISKQFAEPI